MIIPVHSATYDYDIVLEGGALDRIGSLLDLKRKVLIVTDSGVPAEYSEKVAAAALKPTVVCIEQGEKSKVLESFSRLVSVLVKEGFNRNDCVAAVGGGVVGDLSGFTAACYMRGIDFYNIPTTLLSEVDSSIGGKTALDFEGVKNVIGAFYQPSKVVIDTDTLKTLDRRQFNAGLAEAIKIGATCSRELFELIENSSDIEKDLPEVIERALLLKKAVVEQDPKESGLRRVLNFGHTIGQAVEAQAAGELLHGEAVAIGMIPMSGPEAKERIRKVLKKYDLPTEVSCKPEKLLPYLKLDKKKHARTVTAVIVEEIGKFEFREMTLQEIIERI